MKHYDALNYNIENSIGHLIGKLHLQMRKQLDEILAASDLTRWDPLPSLKACRSIRSLRPFRGSASSRASAFPLRSVFRERMCS